MSPEPWVRAHALVLGLAFVASAVLGSAVATLICAAVSAVVAWGLAAKYRNDVHAARASIPRHRERLDLIVAGDARAAFGVGLTASSLLTAFTVDTPDIGQVPATPALVAATAAVIYLSSLFDWYIILPRISGLLGRRPCRNEEGFPTYPRSWRETTRWWWIHRVTAALMLRFGLSFAVGLTLRAHLPRGEAWIIGAALFGALAAYVKAVPRAIFEIGHLTAIVGQTVRRRETKRPRWRLKRRPVGEPGPREYVYDVALEGVQFVPVRARERAIPRDAEGNVLYERRPKKVALKHLDAYEPDERPFRGCRRECAGISWYCIENPECFETK